MDLIYFRKKHSSKGKNCKFHKTASKINYFNFISRKSYEELIVYKYIRNIVVYVTWNRNHFVFIEYS